MDVYLGVLCFCLTGWWCGGLSRNWWFSGHILQQEIIHTYGPSGLQDINTSVYLAKNAHNTFGKTLTCNLQSVCPSVTILLIAYRM